MVVQQLRLRACTAGGAGLIPGLETKICVAWPKKKKKKKKIEYSHFGNFRFSGSHIQE